MSCLVLLSPFTDMGPQTFFQPAPVSNCPFVGATPPALTDNITVTVTNPQSGNSKTSLKFPLLPTTGTTPF